MKRWLMLAAVMLLAVGIVACGDDGGGDTPAATNTPATGAMTPATGGDAEEGDAENGRAIAQANCITCHTTDGSQGVGPTWQGLYGSEVPLESGETVTADEAYIRESILQPQAKIHQGFSPVMPSYQGVLSDEQINDLIAYIRTLE
jgi:mono/diheme cytochrome c family protein